MVDHVCMLVYSWFKYESTVEHLMEIATRYTRSVYLFPTRKPEIYDYLSGWVRILKKVHRHAPEYVRNDPEWSTADLGAALVGLPEYALDPMEFLGRVFRRQIEWCVAYFEFCRDEFVTAATVTGEHTALHPDCARFCTFADQVRTSWMELTDAPIPVTPPQ